MPDRLLTTRQVQEFLNVDRITVYRMVESGQIPGMKVGGQWRFSQTAIDEWLVIALRAAPRGCPRGPHCAGAIRGA